MPITFQSFINLPDTLNPTTDNGAHRVQVVGNFAYIADWITGGLQIWNVGNPTAPTFVGSYNVNTKSRGLQVVGNLVYLADQEFGIKIIDVTTPAAPVLVGSYDTPGKAYRIKVVDELAYVSDGLSGVQILDVSNPASISLVGQAVDTGALSGLPSDSRATDLVGNLLYVADSASGLKIYNVSNPVAPILLNSTDTLSAGGIQVTENYSIVPDGTDGLKVFDVSNPATPVLVETYDTPGKARSITIVGKHGFVADGTSLQVLNVADLTNITFVDSYTISGANVDTARGVEIQGLYAYVGLVDAIKGVQIVDVSDFDNSVLLASAVETINASTGDDSVIGTYANLQIGDSIDGGAGTDTLVISGGVPANTIAINAGSTTNQFNVAGVTIKGFERFDHSGFLGTINFVGSTGNDWVTTGAGADTLNGGIGVDTLSGGLGNDNYIVDSTTDVITENVGEGTDTIQSSISFNLATVNNIENLTLIGTTTINGTGNSGNNALTGNSANNTLIGSLGLDTLNGGAGVDSLVGGTGNDTYIVDTITDYIVENAGEGTDTIQSAVNFNLLVFSNIENLTLTGTAAINGTGNSGANVLTGNSSANVLNGRSGNDILTGAAGKDTLTGGAGIDRFGYRILTDSILANFDVITDFNANASNDLFLVTTTRSGFTNVGAVATLDNAGIIARLNTTNFGINAAAQFTFGTRSFVAINDATAGFSATTDAIIEVTGLTGTLGLTNFVTV